MEHELITVTQAAEILGVKPTTIYYLMNRGDLTPLRLPPRGRLKGKKTYLVRAEVERVKNSWRRHKPREG